MINNICLVVLPTPDCVSFVSPPVYYLYVFSLHATLALPVLSLWLSLFGLCTHTVHSHLTKGSSDGLANMVSYYCQVTLYRSFQ